MWPSSNQNRINLPIIIFRPVIILGFFYVRVFYVHAEDLYGVCAFDDRNNRTLTGRYEANEDMTRVILASKNRLLAFLMTVQFSFFWTVHFDPLDRWVFSFRTVHVMISGPSTFADRPLSVVWTVQFNPLKHFKLEFGLNFVSVNDARWRTRNIFFFFQNFRNLF